MFVSVSQHVHKSASSVLRFYVIFVSNDIRNSYAAHSQLNSILMQWRIQDLTLGGAWTLSRGGGLEIIESVDGLK